MIYRYYIIFPKGDRTRLTVKEISDEDLCDYALASLQDFIEESDAIEYAKQFAKAYNII